MRNFKYSVLFLTSAFLVSCSETVSFSDNNNIIEPVTQYQQEISHLYPEFNTTSEKISNYSPLNYDVKFARWIKYLDYSDIMLNKSESDFRNSIVNLLKEFQNQNINTIYFQVRAFGDAYYKSDIFPKGTFLNFDYDPLEIVIEEAHKLNISVHAWINPLRCQTVEEYKNISDEYILKNWVNEFYNLYICNVDGRMWLNPAYDDVIKLINNGISEIIENYNVDGIHIDDYFYPSTDLSFDSIAFNESGEKNIDKWRINNINRLVSSIYNTIKEYNPDILFGISPQGNINHNYSSQYADVKTWCSKSGFCDYIVPQIYFGFKNETCPFEDTFNQWYDMIKDSEISMSVGLAVYKEGKEDTWAGSGKNEWIEDSNVIQKQKEFIKKFQNVGYSLYY